MKATGSFTVWPIIMAGILLLGCSGQNFGARLDKDQVEIEPEGASTELGGSRDARGNNQDASEPIMVGGGFLGCFIDQSESEDMADSWPVGCSIFADADYHERLDASGVEIGESELAFAGGRQAISLSRLESHPRWSWLTHVPSNRGPYDLILSVKDSQIAESLPKLSIRVGDALPPSLVDDSVKSNEEFLIRLAGRNNRCLGGNPVWSFNDGRSQAADLRVVSCQDALRFQLSPWEDGFRIHTANPNPYACDPMDYHQDFCGRSCIDRVNFGQGRRVTLFGCTFSEEAQLVRFRELRRGNVGLVINGKSLMVDENIIRIPSDDDDDDDDNDSIARFEFVPVGSASASSE